MRFTAAFACFVVTCVCIEKAAGGTSAVFTPDYLWVWWVFAAYWAFAGLRVLIDGAD